AALPHPLVAWAGELRDEDRVDARVRRREFDAFARVGAGSVALDVIAYRDIGLETAASAVAGLGGRVVGRVRSLNALVAEVPLAAISGLVTLRDAIEFVAQAGPALSACNDQVRSAMGVPALEAPPYGLDGSGITALVFDQGLVSTTHPDL